MKLLSAELSCFRSFKGTQRIDFSALAPGLYLVCGENQVERDLGGNGAGKSSVFDGIFWCAFGRTSRGLKAGAVRNWFSESGKCGGILEVECGSGWLAIARTYQPNSLEVVENQDGDPRPVDQTELDRLLGTDADTCLYSCYFSQFDPQYFADLTPGAQTALFSTVLNLSMWERAAERASARVREAERSLSAQRQSHAGLEGEAQALLAQDFDAEESQWKKDQRALLSAARTEATRLETALSGAEANLAKCKGGSESYQAKRGARDAAAREHAHFDAQRMALANAIKDLKSNRSKKCPACGQNLTKAALDHIAEEVGTKEVLLKQAEKETAAALKRHAALSNEAEKFRNAEVEFAAQSKVLPQMRSDLAFAQRRIESVSSAVNPFAAKRLELEKRGDELADKIEAVAAKIVESEKLLAAAEYWIKGFKEIRLSLIRESLDQLTVEANEAIYQFGLPEWSISFDVEKETKSGGVSARFDIVVHAPGLDQPAPWQSWSGGESQRLRLAISMGFANLINARLGSNPTELWDEPTSHLNADGINALLDLLAARAKRYGRVILIADHRSLDYGGFAGTIKIVKDENGSRIEQ